MQTPNEFFIAGKTHGAGSAPVVKLPAMMRSGALLNTNLAPVKVYVVLKVTWPVPTPLVKVIELFPLWAIRALLVRVAPEGTPVNESAAPTAAALMPALGTAVQPAFVGCKVPESTEPSQHAKVTGGVTVEAGAEPPPPHAATRVTTESEAITLEEVARKFMAFPAWSGLIGGVQRPGGWFGPGCNLSETLRPGCSARACNSLTPTG